MPTYLFTFDARCKRLPASYGRYSGLQERIDAESATIARAMLDRDYEGITVTHAVELVTRYVVTARRPGSARYLVDARGNQTYATAFDAEGQRKAYLKNNSKDRLESVGLVNLEVRPCACYPVTFEPVQRYFE